MKYDVVVVGGGPAGASTARYLSQKGAKVLLIERRKLPRFKLCAGCLSARITPLLPKGWESEVLNKVRGGLLGFRGEVFHEKLEPESVAYIVDRSSFDRFLVNSAVEEGTVLWEETEFLSFEPGGTLRVKTDKGTVEANFLVGADGFYTRVGRQLGYRKEKYFRSVEFWTEGDLRDRVVIDIGVVKRGYAWIFPKGDMVSVGLATTGKENTLSVLKDYTAKHKLIKFGEVKKAKGWMIPFITSEGELQLGKENVLLVGDAANLVDPLLGEGIYYGVLGGRLLAEAITEDPSNALTLYGEKLRKEILPDLIYAGKIAQLAYSFQWAAFRMAGGFTMDRFLKLLRGEESYIRLYREGLYDFVKSLLSFENFSHIIIDKILRRR
ncbi:geranylgeranyl reductase family protein [Hydrogenivirga caldilitoris]|uniref:Geranylgeranyl reductase family protein n=1 Tax=Hydrogenivirga caldilitoris TaxID=246264 RepID=A0A497XWZ0_9AQUI|nr:geranylgeranyl reductase family protein [Hydrogenivirga caldilitoris]